MGNVIAERGGTGASEPLYIDMFPNTSNADTECENSIGTRVENICDELYDYGAIDYYQIEIHYDHPNLGTSDKYAYHDNLESWGGWNTSYGVKLGVSEDISGGLADACDGSGLTSFDRATQAVVGLTDGKEFFSNVAIQEILHTFIRYDISAVDQMTNDGDIEHEHDLGIVYNDHSSSPMTTSYEGEHNDHGSCANAPGHWGTYKASLTNCSKKAVRETADSET